MKVLTSLSYVLYGIMGSMGVGIMAYSLIRGIKVYFLSKAKLIDSRTPKELVDEDLKEGSVYCILTGTALAQDQPLIGPTSRKKVIYFSTEGGKRTDQVLRWEVKSFENQQVLVNSERSGGIFEISWNRIFGPRWILPATHIWTPFAKRREEYLENNSRIWVSGRLTKLGSDYEIGWGSFKPFVVSTTPIDKIVIKESSKSLAIFLFGAYLFGKMVMHNWIDPIGKVFTFISPVFSFDNPDSYVD